mgnify:CR=1 FL=1
MDFVLKKELENSNLVYVDLIAAKNISDLRKINYGKKLILVRGGNDDINRAALENKKIDILLGPEFNKEKECLKYE